MPDPQFKRSKIQELSSSGWKGIVIIGNQLYLFLGGRVMRITSVVLLIILIGVLFTVLTYVRMEMMVKGFKDLVNMEVLSTFDPKDGTASLIKPIKSIGKRQDIEIADDAIQFSQSESTLTVRVHLLMKKSFITRTFDVEMQRTFQRHSPGSSSGFSTDFGTESASQSAPRDINSYRKNVKDAVSGRP